MFFLKTTFYFVIYMKITWDSTFSLLKECFIERQPHPFIWCCLWSNCNRLKQPAKSKIQVPAKFEKFALCHCTFMTYLHYYLFLLTKWNPKRIFALMEKGNCFFTLCCFSLWKLITPNRGKPVMTIWPFTKKVCQLQVLLLIFFLTGRG